MDEQTYAARFESMKKHPGSGSRTKQVIVVHKELDRQCKSIIARHKSDTSIVTSELRREQKSLESRIERMKRDRERCMRDGDRNRCYLAETEQRHRDTEQKLAVTASKVAPGSSESKSDTEKREEARLEAEAILRSIDRLVMPAELKLKLTDEINVMYGYLWD